MTEKEDFGVQKEGPFGCFKQSFKTNIFYSYFPENFL